MKKTAILLSGLALAALLLSCEFNGTVKESTSYKLRGVWESIDKSQYSGILEIDSDTIVISGYIESQTSNGKDDGKRPFNMFGRNAHLTCYTEGDELFIKSTGEPEPFHYTYSSTTKDGTLLIFNFGGRDEYLKKWEPTDKNIRGTWVSNDDSVYSGKLEITDTAIKISGYERGQTPSGENDSKRPFRDFNSGVSTACHTEDGKLFIKIKNVGEAQGFSYTYPVIKDGKYLLLFNFGGRDEYLKLRETSNSGTNNGNNNGTTPPDTTQTTDADIRGTWLSFDDEEYSGTLVITSNTIIITGYGGEQTPSGGNDSDRPFRYFIKGTPLTCYTAGGELYVKSAGGSEQILPYTRSNTSYKLLSFTFGGRDEILIYKAY